LSTPIRFGPAPESLVLIYFKTLDLMTIEKKRKTNYPHRIESRISDRKFKELYSIKIKDEKLSMSDVVRTVLDGKPVLIKTVSNGDQASFEKLVDIYTDLHQIGLNINQLVGEFQQSNQAVHKFLLGKKLLKYQTEIEPIVKDLNNLLAQIQQRWLSE
jgi:hypothetical protein